MASFADVSTRADVSTDVDSVDSIDYLRVENGKAKTKKGIIGKQNSHIFNKILFSLVDT